MATYIVLCGKRSAYFPETDAGTSCADVVAEIIADHHHEPRQVFELSLDNGTVRDVSEEVAKLVLTRAREEGYIDDGSLCRSAVEFCERHLPGWYYSMVEAA